MPAGLDIMEFNTYLTNSSFSILHSSSYSSGKTNPLYMITFLMQKGWFYKRGIVVSVF
jgi:hypothetical protein